MTKQTILVPRRSFFSRLKRTYEVHVGDENAELKPYYSGVPIAASLLGRVVFDVSNGQLPNQQIRQDQLWENLRNQNEGIPQTGTEKTKEEGIPEEEISTAKKWLNVAKVVLPHIGLALLTMAYMVIGGSVFHSIELPREKIVKRESLSDIYSVRKDFYDIMWTQCHNRSMSKEEWMRLGSSHFESMTNQLYHVFYQSYLSAAEINENKTILTWTWPRSIFFAATVVTTIGYGNPVPVSFTGRLICILYGLFGIPLTLITIADIGKFFGEHLIWLYTRFMLFWHWFSIKTFNRKHFLPGTIGFRNKTSFQENRENPQAIFCDQCSLDEKILEAQLDRKVPVTIVIAILLAYTALGALLLQRLETWPYFDAFYFSFITMTTVGFGDMVPQQNAQLFVLLAYILVGLSITTMCIDIVGFQYLRKIHYFGRKMQYAPTALAIVGGKVVAFNRLRRKTGSRGIMMSNIYFPMGLYPFIPRDIHFISYIDEGSDSLPSSTPSLYHDNLHCRLCK